MYPLLTGGDWFHWRPQWRGRGLVISRSGRAWRVDVRPFPWRVVRVRNRIVIRRYGVLPYYGRLLRLLKLLLLFLQPLIRVFQGIQALFEPLPLAGLSFQRKLAREILYSCQFFIWVRHW